MQENPKSTDKEGTSEQAKPEEEFSPMEFYASIIADKYTSANENDYDVETSAEHLLLKWCSEPATPSQVNDLVNQLRIKGFIPTALPKNNNFELVYLLKNKS